jgi:type II secretory pathway pseudopilin PulG
MMIKNLSPLYDPCQPGPRDAEGGWAMLGLILAMMILGIAMTAAAPNIKMQVQREKEAELMYRGEQMAEAIARYYNFGNLGPINVRTPPPYGYLTDLEKLREGVTLGVREIKFVRPSALIDPMRSDEWEPVRVRDPRIMPALQAFAAEKRVQIPDVYMLLAGPPPKLNIINPPGNPDSTGGQQPSNSNQSPPPANSNQSTRGGNADADADSDQDPDSDDDANDPLAHLLELDKSNLPIVGVATKMRGPTVKALYGFTNYEEWVFIFIPDQNFRILNPNQNNRNRNRINEGIRRRPP